MAKGAAARPTTVDASARIIVLHGKDPFQLDGWTTQVIDALRDAHGEIERFDYDGETAQLADVLDELRSYGLIQQHKLVVLDKAEKFLAGDERHRPAMEKYAAAPVDSATLLMRAETWRVGKIDKAIKKNGMIVKVEPPSESQAVTWCLSRARDEHGCTIDRNAAESLVNLIGADLQRLDTELAKLASFVSDGQPVSRAVVGELVGQTREEEVWSLQSLIAAGDAPGALARLRELLGNSKQPRELVTWAILDLARKIHGASRLLRQQVPGGAIAKQLRLWGESQRLILEVAKAIDPRTAAELFSLAVQTDRNNKSGVGHIERSLETLTLRIADTLRRR